ncbi:MAG TPA: penicillin-binding protein [Bacteroidales bacterium]|nr:penicillin-binding protein [Bacteroidales bacterium]
MTDTKKDILWRVYLVYIGMFVLGLTIIGRIVYIQVAEGDKWREKARKLSLRYFNIEATRGNIYDANGEFLSTSVPIFEVRMDVASPYITDDIFKKEADSLAYRLSDFFKDRSKREYKTLITRGRAEKNRYLLLKRNVNYDQLKTLKTFPIFRNGKNKGGLIAKAVERRIQPYSHLAFRTIGWDKEGKQNDLGLEGAYSDELEGESGKRLMQRIANGNWRPLNNENEIDPRNGSDIVSTVDIHLQDVAEDALMKQLIANDADHGCAILMEVKTGRVKAIANLGKNADGQYEEKYNYAIGEASEPGSTFKLYSLLAALEDDKTDLDEKIDCNGGIAYYANRAMKDSHLGTGVLTVKQIFEKSSNVGVSKVIYKAYASNPQAFIDRLYSFSVNKPLNLEIAGEGKPRIKDTHARSWSKVSLPWMSIGYEVALTPLQILTFYNAVANDGVMIKPRFVDEIRLSDKVIKKFGPVIINPKIASKKAIRKAKIMLEGVVQEGTGTSLRNPVYKVAGKTGTAQIAMNNAGYNKSSYKGTFVGYFPADNPKYSCIVVINNPTKGVYYGGAISAPVFREIADRVYAADMEMGLTWDDSVKITHRVPFKGGFGRDMATICRWMGYNMQHYGNNWITSDSSGRKTVAMNYKSGIVPDVCGMGMRDAMFLLEKQGYKVRATGVGLVRRQSLQAGTRARAGSLVELNLDI